MSIKLKPSPSMVVALLALFVALSGASYAAVKLGRNAVKTRNIANKAVKTSKLGNAAVTGPKLAGGAVGAANLAPGLQGQAVAWASVNGDGTIASSRGISAANMLDVSDAGVFCLGGLPNFGTASVTPRGTLNLDGDFTIAANFDPATAIGVGCDPATELAVVTQLFDNVSGAATYVGRGFIVVLHE